MDQFPNKAVFFSPSSTEEEMFPFVSLIIKTCLKLLKRCEGDGYICLTAPWRLALNGSQIRWGKHLSLNQLQKKAKLLRTRKAYSNKYMKEQKQADIHLHKETYKPKKQDMS